MTRYCLHVAWCVAVAVACCGLLPNAVDAQQFSLKPSVLNTHPTVSEFREEINQADVVIRARIEHILRRKEGRLADQDATVKVLEFYKGKLPEEFPCIRMEIHQSPERRKGFKLPLVGDEIILPIKFVYPNTGSRPPNGQKAHYMALHYYTVAADGAINSAFGFPPAMQAQAKLPLFAKFISEQVNRPRRKRPHFKTAEVLFTDDFNDGSLAGWTFLTGRHGFTEPPLNRDIDVMWIGPHTVLDNNMKFAGEPPTVALERNPKSGLYFARHNNTTIEFGVVEGRLRMRSSHIHRHFTLVTGDPQWTDYQIDLDVFNMLDIEQPHARRNYKKFGPYGRVSVPNFPETRGEHSFVGVEFGNFANYDLSEGTFGNSAFQIRCKYPEPLTVWRDHSRLLRLTKILDFQPWPIPEKKKIHITARYFGDYVEGLIDGKKVLEGRIPHDHPGVEKGRIALWAFETWVEFDNVKVTRLVAADEKDK